MPEFPASPLSPKEFLEDWLPRAFKEAEVPEEARQIETRLGVQLDGEGGGEWVFQVKQGELAVEASPREETAFTVVQSVDDWRGALWEGRGGAIGRQAASVFKPGSAAAQARRWSSPRCLPRNCAVKWQASVPEERP